MSEKVVRTKVEMRSSAYLSTLFVPVEVDGFSWGDQVVILHEADYNANAYADRVEVNPIALEKVEKAVRDNLLGWLNENAVILKRDVDTLVGDILADIKGES